MAVPDYQSLMLPVLMASTGGEVRIGDTVDRIAEQLALTSDDRAQLLPSGKQTLFGNRVHWAKTYLSKAGLLESTRRGYFKITERGQQVIATHSARIDNEFLNQFAEFRQFKEKSANDATQSAQTIEKALVSSTETLDEIMRGGTEAGRNIARAGSARIVFFARPRLLSSSALWSTCFLAWVTVVPRLMRAAHSGTVATMVLTA